MTSTADIRDRGRFINIIDSAIKTNIKEGGIRVVRLRLYTNSEAARFSIWGLVASHL